MRPKGDVSHVWVATAKLPTGQTALSRRRNGRALQTKVVTCIAIHQRLVCAVGPDIPPVEGLPIMPLFKVIPSSEAPQVPKRQSQYAIDLLRSVDTLKKNEVLRVTPDEGKSLRGLRAGIGRILKSAGIQTRTWDDGTHAYISKL
jgi:hypothetical protein